MPRLNKKKNERRNRDHHHAAPSPAFLDLPVLIAAVLLVFTAATTEDDARRSASRRNRHKQQSLKRPRQIRAIDPIVWSIQHMLLPAISACKQYAWCALSKTLVVLSNGSSQHKGDLIEKDVLRLMVMCGVTRLPSCTFQCLPNLMALIVDIDWKLVSPRLPITGIHRLEPPHQPYAPRRLFLLRLLHAAIVGPIQDQDCHSLLGQLDAA